MWNWCNRYCSSYRDMFVEVCWVYVFVKVFWLRRPIKWRFNIYWCMCWCEGSIHVDSLNVPVGLIQLAPDRKIYLVGMMMSKDLGHLQTKDFMTTPEEAVWRATNSSQVIAPHIHARSLSRLAVSRILWCNSDSLTQPMHFRCAGTRAKPRPSILQIICAQRSPWRRPFRLCSTYGPIRGSLRGQASATSPWASWQQPSTSWRRMSPSCNLHRHQTRSRTWNRHAPPSEMPWDNSTLFKQVY